MVLEAVSFGDVVGSIPLTEEELEPLTLEGPVTGEESDDWQKRATDEQAVEQPLVSAARGAGEEEGGAEEAEPEAVWVGGEALLPIEAMRKHTPPHARPDAREAWAVALSAHQYAARSLDHT